MYLYCNNHELYDPCTMCLSHLRNVEGPSSVICLSHKSTQLRSLEWHISHLGQFHDTLHSVVFEEIQLMNKLMSPSPSKVYLLTQIYHWGTLMISIFQFLTVAGSKILCWGISCLNRDSTISVLEGIWNFCFTKPHHWKDRPTNMRHENWALLYFHVFMYNAFKCGILTLYY